MSHDKIVNLSFSFRYARQLMEETIRRNASPVREGSERERMGGSSSSLNSSASDESNRLNQPGFAIFAVIITEIIFTMVSVYEMLGKGLFLLLSSQVRTMLFKTYSKARPVHHN